MPPARKGRGTAGVRKMPKAVADRLELEGVTGPIRRVPQRRRCPDCRAWIWTALEDCGFAVGPPVDVTETPTDINGQVIAYLHGLPLFEFWKDALIRHDVDSFGFGEGMSEGIHPMHVCGVEFPIPAWYRRHVQRVVESGGEPPF